MPTYVYEAIDRDGVRHKGEIVTASREAAMADILAKHLSLLSLRTAGEEKASALNLPFFQRISSTDKVLLARHLSVMLRAGLGMGDMLNILIVDAENPAMRRILEQAKYNLERGQQLSTTFSAYPQYFTPVFVGLVKAGEMSGNLEQTMERLSTQMQRENELVRRTLSIMIYPAILLIASVILVTFLLTFVVPKIANAFLQVGVPLPFLTRVFIGMSNIMTSSPIIAIGFPLSMFALMYLAVGTQFGHRFFGEIFWKIPLTRKLVKKLTLARFSRTLGTLLQSGLTMLESLEITANAIGNIRYRRSLLRLMNDIKKGLPLTETFRQAPELYPHMLTSMMAVGEKAGNLEDMLITVGDFYEEDADRVLKNLVTLLEPLLLLLMGLIVGSIALSILLPIYQLVGSLR